MPGIIQETTWQSFKKNCELCAQSLRAPQKIECCSNWRGHDLDRRNCPLCPTRTRLRNETSGIKAFDITFYPTSESFQTLPFTRIPDVPTRKMYDIFHYAPQTFPNNHRVKTSRKLHAWTRQGEARSTPSTFIKQCRTACRQTRAFLYLDFQMIANCKEPRRFAFYIDKLSRRRIHFLDWKRNTSARKHFLFMR